MASLMSVAWGALVTWEPFTSAQKTSETEWSKSQACRLGARSQGHLILFLGGGSKGKGFSLGAQLSWCQALLCAWERTVMCFPGQRIFHNTLELEVFVFLFFLNQGFLGAFQ